MRPSRACFVLLAVLFFLGIFVRVGSAQSQGVGVTIQAPASSSAASPQPAATSAPSTSGGAPGSTGGATTGTPTVSGTTQTPGASGGSGLLPRTGVQLAGLLAGALALITFGQVVASWARRLQDSSAA